MKRQPHHIMSFHSSTYSIFGTPWPRITGGELILAANIPQVSYCLGVRILLTFKKQQKNRGLQRLLYDNTGFTWVYMGLHHHHHHPCLKARGAIRSLELPLEPRCKYIVVKLWAAEGIVPKMPCKMMTLAPREWMRPGYLDDHWWLMTLMTLMTLAHWTIGGIPCMWWKPWFHWGFP